MMPPPPMPRSPERNPVTSAPAISASTSNASSLQGRPANTDGPKDEDGWERGQYNCLYAQRNGRTEISPQRGGKIFPLRRQAPMLAAFRSAAGYPWRILKSQGWPPA